MALVTEATSVTPSGLNHIDALLDSGPGWNWLTPARNVIRYTFSVASGNETGNTEISAALVAFNASQQSACVSQLAYISQLTGITFVATTVGTDADLHFASTNLLSDPSVAGLCSWGQSWSFTADNTLTSYRAQAYVYLDNVEWARENGTPTAGTSGYETLLHEIGHAMGLKHPFDGATVLPTNLDNTANSIMSYTSSGGPYSTFSPFDVAALMWLYGGDGLGGSLGVSTKGQYLVGSFQNETINAGSGNDYLDGLSGDDSLFGGTGDDTLVGGSGTDTAVYVGSQAAYVITQFGSGYSVKSATEGTDTLSTIEFLKFADKTVALVSLDTSPPVVTQLSPADEAVNVALSITIAVTFNEPINRGSGNILIKTAAGATVATFPAATSTNLVLVGSTLTIKPTSDLAPNTAYSVEFAAGSIKDLAGNSYSSTTAYNFTTQAGTATGKVVTGTNANDFLSTSAGNDTIDGLGGVDTVALTGTRADHTMVKTSSGWSVSSAADGVDTLSNIERLKFSDVSLALDTDGAAGKAYRIYQAAFDRAPDAGGLGYWISILDSGANLTSVAQEFVNSPEFISMYGANPTNMDLVTKMYSNVFHRAPDSGGLNYWVGILDNKLLTVAGVLAQFGESAENQAALIGVIGSGIPFTPFGG